MSYSRGCFCGVSYDVGSDNDRDDGSCRWLHALAAVDAECFSLMGLFAKVVWWFGGTSSVS